MERNLLRADVTRTSTDQKFRLGTTVTVGDATYIYVKATAVITQYYFCIITAGSDATSPWGATAMTTTIAGAIPQAVGCAQVAFASGEYGWVAIAGKFTGFVGASCAQDVKLYTHATAGLVDDTATTLVSGVMLETTVSAANQNAACYAFREMSVNG